MIEVSDRVPPHKAMVDAINVIETPYTVDILTLTLVLMLCLESQVVIWYVLRSNMKHHLTLLFLSVGLGLFGSAQSGS